jgi:hypothetical protein
MSTTGKSGTSSFKGLDNKHKAIAKAVFQVLAGNAIIADANRRLCQIRDDPVSLAEVQEPEGVEPGSLQIRGPAYGGPRVRSHLPPAKSLLRT